MSKILIIENDSTQLDRLSFSLEKSGFEILARRCIISGLESTRAQQPDAILCSDNLPGLGAIDLLDLIREESALSGIPVVVVSEENHDKLDCFRAGCDDFILMPADEGELALRVGAIIKRGKNSGVSGSFSHISVFDLIQLFMGARQTGLMNVDCGDFSGEIGVDTGQVVFAHSSRNGVTQEGEDAFVDILKTAQAGGMFQFEKKSVEGRETNIEKRTDHLLLGIANMLDES